MSRPSQPKSGTRGKGTRRGSSRRAGVRPPEDQVTFHLPRVESCLLLFGAGAQERSWDPVRSALRACGNGAVESNESASAILSNLVYYRRFWHAAAELPGDDQEPDAEWLRERDEADSNYREAVDAIGVAVRAAEAAGELAERAELAAVVNDFVARIPRIALMTTNWDETTTNALKRRLRVARTGEPTEVSVFHIHGSVHGEDSLLLPTEISLERYHTPEESRRHFTRHGQLAEAVADAERVVIYGLALSPHDEELCVALTEGTRSGATRQVIIVDPAHEVVATRFMARLPCGDVAVVGYKPTKLSSPTLYEWPAVSAGAP